MQPLVVGDVRMQAGLMEAGLMQSICRDRVNGDAWVVFHDLTQGSSFMTCRQHYKCIDTSSA